MSIFVDMFIIFILFMGFVKGWQDGFLRSLVDFIGTVVILIVSFIIKTPLAEILYKNLPFFHFKGTFAGISSFNILLYEGIAYISCVIILSIIFQTVIAATGISGKLKNTTYAHKMPSRLGGMFFSFLEIYVYAFVLLYLGSLIPYTTELVQNAHLSPVIINQTPLLSTGSKKLYKTVSQVYKICKDSEDNELADYNSLEVLLKYDIISPENVEYLVKEKKIKVDEADVLIEKYKKEKK